MFKQIKIVMIIWTKNKNKNKVKRMMKKNKKSIQMNKTKLINKIYMKIKN